MDQSSGSASPLVAPSHECHQQENIIMRLGDSALWKYFSHFEIEMLITKAGRRMFPTCSISVSGLLLDSKYVIMVEMVRVDEFRYKWKNQQWKVAGNGEPPSSSGFYIHPDSPALGSHWMRQPISFIKLKVTNNPLNKTKGHLILHSMHRYKPRFHVVCADDLQKVQWSPSKTFTFRETIFTAVTVYQNDMITEMKIKLNSYARGYREDGLHTAKRRAQQRQENSENIGNVGPEPIHYQGWPGIPHNLQGAHSNFLMLSNNALMAQNEDMFTRGAQQNPGQTLYNEGAVGFPNSELLVSGQTMYQPHSSQEFWRMPLPYVINAHHEFNSFQPGSIDMTTGPQQYLSRSIPSINPASQNEAINIFLTQASPQDSCQEFGRMSLPYVTNAHREFNSFQPGSIDMTTGPQQYLARSMPSMNPTSQNEAINISPTQASPQDSCQEFARMSSPYIPNAHREFNSFQPGSIDMTTGPQQYLPRSMPSMIPTSQNEAINISPTQASPQDSCQEFGRMSLPYVTNAHREFNSFQPGSIDMTTGPQQYLPRSMPSMIPTSQNEAINISPTQASPQDSSQEFGRMSSPYVTNAQPEFNSFQPGSIDMTTGPQQYLSRSIPAINPAFQNEAINISMTQASPAHGEYPLNGHYGMEPSSSYETELQQESTQAAPIVSHIHMTKHLF